MIRNVRFNKSPLLGDDLCYVKEAISSGLTFGDGPLTRDAESLLLSEFESASGVLLTSSCTHALASHTLAYSETHTFTLQIVNKYFLKK